MNYKTVILLITFATVSVAFADGLPSKTNKALQSFDSSIRKAKMLYLKSVKREKAKLAKILKADIKMSTRKGNRDTADLIAAKLAVLDDFDCWKSPGESKGLSKSNGDTVTKKILNKLVGKWKSKKGDHVGVIITFDENGKWSSPWPSWHGTWDVENQKVKMKPTGSNRHEIETDLNGNTLKIRANIIMTLKKTK